MPHRSRCCASSTSCSSSSPSDGRARPDLHAAQRDRPQPRLRAPRSDGTVAVVHPGVGAPLAAGFVEEMAALGVTTFVACGGAGALVDELGARPRHGRRVGSARRGDQLPLRGAEPHHRGRPRGVEVLESDAERARVPHFVGGPGPPTPSSARRAAGSRAASTRGAPMVDMESSAFIAVARYRGLRFAQMLYAGDSLAGDDMGLTPLGTRARSPRAPLLRRGRAARHVARHANP